MSNHNRSSRCCELCYHFGDFMYYGKSCELTHKKKKAPWLYTNCKEFRYVDIMGGPVEPKEMTRKDAE